MIMEVTLACVGRRIEACNYRITYASPADITLPCLCPLCGRLMLVPMESLELPDKGSFGRRPDAHTKSRDYNPAFDPSLRQRYIMHELKRHKKPLSPPPPPDQRELDRRATQNFLSECKREATKRQRFF